MSPLAIFRASSDLFMTSTGIIFDILMTIARTIFHILGSLVSFCFGLLILWLFVPGGEAINEIFTLFCPILIEFIKKHPTGIFELISTIIGLILVFVGGFFEALFHR